MSDTTVNQTQAVEEIKQPDVMDSPAAKSSLGAALAARREAHAWSIEQVALQLKLAPRQIQALEEDNFAALPGMASVRGFIRSYAKLLKMEPEPLLAMIADVAATALNEPASARRALSEPFSSNRHLPLMSKRNPMPKSMIALGAFIVAAAGAFIVYQTGVFETIFTPSLKESKVASAAPLVSTGKVATSPPVASNLASQSAEARVAGAAEIMTNDMPQAGAASPSPVAPAANVVSAIPTAATTATPATVAPVTNPVASSTKTPPMAGTVESAADKEALVLKVREDSWVSVKSLNPDNKAANLLMSRMIKAGTTEKFDTKDAVSITLGNATGVDVFWHGVLIDTKQGGKGNVVRLTLK